MKNGIKYITLLIFSIIFSINPVGAAWLSNSSELTGLAGTDIYSSPFVYQKDSSWVFMNGENTYSIYGYTWNGTGWVSNSSEVLGLSSGTYALMVPRALYMNGVWNIILGNSGGASYKGYTWNGTGWTSNTSLVNGLSTGASHTIFQRDSTWSLINGKSDGTFSGYTWNGAGWTSNSSEVTGLGDIGSGSAPFVFQKGPNRVLIAGRSYGDFLGFTWNGSQWVGNASETEGLTDIGSDSIPTIFYKDTKYRLISGKGAGGFSGFIYDNVPTISNISSSYSLVEGQTLYIDANYVDADGDTGTFARNFTKGTFNTSTGILSWATVDGDLGTYNWQINVSDGYGGVAYTDFTVTVRNSTPSVISNLVNNTGNFWINWTYTGGLNDDDYDIWINNSDLGADTTNLYYNATYAAHATRTISIRGHNHTLGSYSSWVNQTTTISNNAPVMVNISLTPSTPLDTDTLTISSNATDEDSDTITKHYLWYKNSALQSAWTDLTYILPTGNFSANDLIYVSGYVNDGYINSSFLSSGVIQINGSNPAPLLSGISLSSSTRKYNKTIYVNTTANVTDASSLIIFRTYYKVAEVKYYLNNSSWVTPNTNFSLEITIPFNDGLTHNIYASVEDNGNMTSSEAFVVFTSDINAPTKLTDSLSAGSTNIGSTMTIYLSTACQQTSGFTDCSINNATVSLLNGGTGNTTVYNMSFYSGVLWYYTFSPSTTGVYSVSGYSVTDDSNVTGTLSSSLSFTVNPVSSGSSGSPGGGIVAATTTKPLVPAVVENLYDETTGITLQDINEDPLGKTVLWILFLISLIMIYVALTQKNTKESTAGWGMILFGLSTFALGWWA